MKSTLRMKYRQTFKTTESILKERKIRYRTWMFFIKQISNRSKWWYWLAWHKMGQPRHFLLMGVEWKWMHRHTNDIYGKNFYVLFNAFIYIKTGFLYKTMHHYTFQTTYKIFYKKHLFTFCQNTRMALLVTWSQSPRLWFLELSERKSIWKKT